MKTFAFKPITYYRVAMWFFVVATMCAIFFFSAQTGEQSTKTSDKFVTVIEHQFTPSQPTTTTSSDVSNDTSSTPAPTPNVNNMFYVKLVRNGAHIIIFTALGFFLYGAISSYKGKKLLKLLLSFLAGTLYAVFDEVHQYFIPGRGCEINDMLFDALGVAIGICIMLFVVLIIKSITKNKALGV